jgi:hypothetical protein
MLRRWLGPRRLEQVLGGELGDEPLRVGGCPVAVQPPPLRERRRPLAPSPSICHRRIPDRFTLTYSPRASVNPTTSPSISRQTTAPARRRIRRSGSVGSAIAAAYPGLRGS